MASFVIVMTMVSSCGESGQPEASAREVILLTTTGCSVDEGTSDRIIRFDVAVDVVKVPGRLRRTQNSFTFLRSSDVLVESSDGASPNRSAAALLLMKGADPEIHLPRTDADAVAVFLDQVEVGVMAPEELAAARLEDLPGKSLQSPFGPLRITDVEQSEGFLKVRVYGTPGHLLADLINWGPNRWRL